MLKVRGMCKDTKGLCDHKLGKKLLAHALCCRTCCQVPIYGMKNSSRAFMIAFIFSFMVIEERSICLTLSLNFSSTRSNQYSTSSAGPCLFCSVKLAGGHRFLLWGKGLWQSLGSPPRSRLVQLLLMSSHNEEHELRRLTEFFG